MSHPDFIDCLEPHYDDAVNYCRGLCSNSTRAEAEDVMQQALLRAYEYFETLEDADKFRSWLFRIVTRTFYNTVRKPYWSRFFPFSSQPPDTTITIYEEDYFEENQVLTLALSRLSKKQRAAILLFEIGGFSVREIADLQGDSSESTVRSRLMRSRDTLRAFVEDEESEDRAASTRLNRSSTDFLGETTRIIRELNSNG